MSNYCGLNVETHKKLFSEKNLLLGQNFTLMRQILNEINFQKRLHWGKVCKKKGMYSMSQCELWLKWMFTKTHARRLRTAPPHPLRTHIDQTRCSCTHTLPQAAGHSADATSRLERGEDKQQMVPLGKDGTQCGKCSPPGHHRPPQPGEGADSGHAELQRG